MLNFLLSVIVFLPFVASTGSADVATAQAANVDFDVQVCESVATCGEPVADGLTLVVTNETHPTVASTADGAHIPYSETFPVPADGRVYVADTTGGMFDVYVVDADGIAGLYVQPVTTFGNGYVLSFNVMAPTQ